MPPFVPRKRRASKPPLESPEPKVPRTRVQNAITTAKKRNNIDLGDSDSESLSDIPSDQFEDVEGLQKAVAAHAEDEDEDDVGDWEDAIDPNSSTLASKPDTPLPIGDLEFSLDKHVKIPSTAELYSGSKGPSKIERQIRVQTHCMHVQFQLFHNLVRNAWTCDKEVQRILVARLPQGVLKEVERWKVASGMDPKGSPRESKGSKKNKGNSRAHTDRNQRDWGKRSERLEKGAADMSRGDPLVHLLKIIAAYWKKRFVVTAPGLRKMGYKPASVLQDEVKSFHNKKHDPELHGEKIGDLEEFRRLAKHSEGSRDVGAQLFTALLRGLGIDSRLVASLQPLGFGWSKSEDATISDKAGEDGEDGNKGDQSVKEMIDADNQRPAKTVAHQQKRGPRKSKLKSLSKNQGKGKTKNDSIELTSSDEDSALVISNSEEEIIVERTTSPALKRSSKKFDQDLCFPIYWTEAISPISNEVIPVESLVLPNSIAASQELLATFEPRGTKATQVKQVISYVVAYSQDGTAKDVTTRYLKRHMWPGQTKGVRMPIEKVPIYDKAGKVKKYEEYDWFKDILRHYTRSSDMRTVVDDLEEAKDLKAVKTEKKAVKDDVDTLQSLKASAEFILERFLRREEALNPGSQHVRLFKSGKGEKVKEEKVYLRKDVKRCLSAESWHKDGRKVKHGEYPLKLVPVRAVTTARKREVEEAERQTGEKSKQGLYSKDQTEWIIPPPIKDGVIPKNAFGNIDCFVPSMIPKGAVHIPFRGTVRICKKMEIDFAEAVTGFEFGNKMAVPVIQGVIVAAEYEHAVVSAWEVAEEEKRRKEEVKQNKLVLGTWRKFLIGLRIAERMRNEYGDQEDHNVEEANVFARKKNATSWVENGPSVLEPNDEFTGGGGFLVGMEDEQLDGPSGDIVVDHGEDSKDNGSPDDVALLSNGKNRVAEVYPQTSFSLGSNKKKSTKAAKPRVDTETGTFSSALSDLSSLAPNSESEPEVIEKGSKAAQSGQQRAEKQVPTKMASTPKRALRSRGAKGKEAKSPYFD